MNLSNIIVFLKDIINSRKLIFELAKKEMQIRYLGSYLGVIWAFIQPAINIMILWFVFQVGFKSTPIDNFPFILWLICGMLPWLFFADCIQSGTNSILENSYLVKKVVFRVEILPIIRIISATFIHMFFIFIIFIMFLIYGYKPTVYNLQVFYYLLCMIMLGLGITWVTSALMVFLKDMGQIVAMCLQFGFWLTPIFWSFKIIPEKYSFILKLNPMFYVIEGYRESFIYKEWFWNHHKLTAIFWITTLIFLVIGITLFKKLKPHFADVL